MSLPETVTSARTGANHRADHEALHKRHNDAPNIRADYGAGLGGDDTPLIQAAIDDAQTAMGADAYGAPPIDVPPGRYSINDTIVWKSAQIRGSFVHTGARFVWDAAAGGTMIERESTNVAGGVSFNSLENLSLMAGTNQPATFIDFTTGYDLGTIDVFGQLNNVYFQGCSGDAIKVAYWVNAHWSHLRWDGVGGFAIRLTATSEFLDYMSFVLSNFTYDNNGGGGLGAGFLMIDNTDGAGDIGIVKLENARVEMNQPWTGNKAFVEIKGDTAVHPVGLHLADIALAGNGSGNSILYSNSANANMTHKLLMTNVQAQTFTNVCGGTWYSGLTLPSMVGHWQYFSLPGLGSPAFNIGNAGVYHYGGSPEAVIPAQIGSIYTDTTNGELYVKKTGTGDTGWKKVTIAA